MDRASGLHTGFDVTGSLPHVKGVIRESATDCAQNDHTSMYSK
jgi:hypothetical protein